MKIDSRSFDSRRYKALYFLLPLFNGAVIVSGHYALRRITGGPLLDTGLSAGATGILTDFVYFAAALVVPGLVICSLEIFALGVIYRRNVVPFALRRLRLKQDEEGNSLPVAGPFLLTVAGAMAVVLTLRLLSAWIPEGGGLGSTAIVFVTAFLYALTVVPVLALCELAAADRANGDAEGAGA